MAYLNWLVLGEKGFNAGDFGSPFHIHIQDSVSPVDSQQLSKPRHLSALQSLKVAAVQDVGL